MSRRKFYRTQRVISDGSLFLHGKSLTIGKTLFAPMEIDSLTRELLVDNRIVSIELERMNTNLKKREKNRNNGSSKLQLSTTFQKFNL